MACLPGRKKDGRLARRTARFRWMEVGEGSLQPGNPLLRPRKWRMGEVPVPRLALLDPGLWPSQSSGAVGVLELELMNIF